MNGNKVSKIKTIKLIKALRGDSLTIDLQKTYDGTLNAWMKKERDSDSYRSFDIVENRYLYLSETKTKDYLEEDGTVIEEVAGNWYFDVEFTPTIEGTPTQLELNTKFAKRTIFSGTIFFQNDITGTNGTEIVDPNTTIFLEGYAETGTKAGGDLIVTIGDHNESNNGTRVEIDDDNETVKILTNGETLVQNLRLFSPDLSNSVGISTSNITENRQINVPNKNGTIALIEDLSAVGGGGGVIPCARSFSTSNSSYLYHAQRSYGIAPSPEVHSRDAWLAGSSAASANRVMYLFGAQFELSALYFINYYNNNNGSMNPVTGTGNAGVNECIIYSLDDDITPSTNFGANLDDMTEIFNGSLPQIIDKIFTTKINLTNPVQSYGYIIDVINNHGGSNIGIRKTFAV